MTYRVIIVSRAHRDLLDAFDFIKEESQDRAVRWMKDVFAAIQSLRHMPGRCPIAPDSTYVKQELRHLVFQEYRVLFTIDHAQHEVHVVAVRHGARLFLNQRPPAEHHEEDD